MFESIITLCGLTMNIIPLRIVYLPSIVFSNISTLSAYDIPFSTMEKTKVWNSAGPRIVFSH
jgi:hypothetical protein